MSERTERTEQSWKIWRCPECGESVPEHYGPPEMPGRGHYHDNPDDRHFKRVFHPAEEVEVIPLADAQKLEAERDLFSEQGLGDAGRLIEVEDERDGYEAEFEDFKERLTSSAAMSAARSAYRRASSRPLTTQGVEAAVRAALAAASENPESTEEGTR